MGYKVLINITLDLKWQSMAFSLPWEVDFVTISEASVIKTRTVVPPYLTLNGPSNL